MTSTQHLPTDTIAAHSAKLAGPRGYIDGLLVFIPGSAFFVANGQPMRTGTFVPVNRSGIWATLDDNGDVLVQVGSEGEQVVRTSGCSTELQKLGVPTYHHGQQLDFQAA
jgi:hypothetical protein